ncbi:MAG TPA: MYXO-CTERM sorting domain-containing protein [Polyangiaceae bacterium]
MPGSAGSGGANGVGGANASGGTNGSKPPRSGKGDSGCNIGNGGASSLPWALLGLVLLARRLPRRSSR